ncbi:hypothetical protein AYK26_00720 [Euryarchaeota archaeon SM23-78]|nr:MAG: hypothetical protein AYK26_00720 [Euryarchaeota archaeon SM23-78]
MNILTGSVLILLGAIVLAVDLYVGTILIKSEKRSKKQRYGKIRNTVIGALSLGAACTVVIVLGILRLLDKW